MNSFVQKYIERIKANDYSLESIFLVNLNLVDADIAPLMKALMDKPGLAGGISILDLSHNKLTEISIPTGLRVSESLNLMNNQIKVIIIGERVYIQSLNITGNPITTATRLALNSEAGKRIIKFEFFWPLVCESTILNQKVLDQHFVPMLQVNPANAIEYLKNLGIMRLLPILGYDIIDLLVELLPPPEIVQAYASMAYLQGALNQRSDDDVGFKTMLLLNLESYKARFDTLVGATREYFHNVFVELQNDIWQKIVDEKCKSKNDNPQELNQPDVNLYLAPQALTFGVRNRALRDDTLIDPAKNPFQLTLRNW